MESPIFARRVRTSLVLLVVWGISLFVATLPNVGLAKQLPTWLGWPCALYACWSLRSYSKCARVATVAVLVTTVIAVLRELMPLQVMHTAEDVSKVSVSLALATIGLSMARDIATVVAIVLMGRFVAEIAEPIEVDEEETLVDRAQRHYLYLGIGWTVAAIWRFVIAFCYLFVGEAYLEFMNSLPAMVSKLCVAGPAIIKVFVIWNVVLVLFSLIAAWHSVVEVVAKRFEGPDQE